jgi:hypothetical protein
MSTIDYEAVLADLREKRDKLDTAIAAIEQLVLGRVAAPGQAIAAGSISPGQPDASEVSRTIESDTFFGMTASDATRKYLRMTKRPASLNAILAALQEGGYLTNSKNFYSNLYTTLSRLDDFVKVGKNWALVEWYPGRRLDQKTRSFVGSDGTRNGGAEPILPPKQLVSFHPDAFVESEEDGEEESA